MASVTPTMTDIFEEAYERIGLQLRSGYDLKTARRSLNILLLEWQNRGLNLFTVDEGTQALTAGTASYTLPTGTIDLIEHYIRSGSGTSQIDQNLERISVSTYSGISAKNVQGRPTQVYIDRQYDGVTVTLWPIPDASTYTFVYYRLKAIDGLSEGIGDTPSVPPRFIPALIAGLAFHLSLKNPDSQGMAQALRAEYEYQYQLAAEEDQDASTLYITPSSEYLNG